MKINIAKARGRLGRAVGLTQFGVNLLELGPGAWSSQRHWHALEDEFVYVLKGPVVLVTDVGERLDRRHCQSSIPNRRACAGDA